MPSRRWRQRDVRRRRDHEKCSTQVDVVCRSLGVPGPRSQPRWWIVRNVDEVALAALEPAEWKLEHVFLRTSDGSESRVTKKSSVGGGPATYHHRVHRGVPSCGVTPSTCVHRTMPWVVFFAISGPFTMLRAGAREDGRRRALDVRTNFEPEGVQGLAQNARPGPPEDQEDAARVFVAGRVLHARHLPLAGVGLRC